MNIEAVFIDRDGTIGGTGHFIHPKDFSPYPFSRAALQILKDNHIKTFACTNQHRIGRGEATLADSTRNFNHMNLMMPLFVHIVLMMAAIVISRNQECFWKHPININ